MINIHTHRSVITFLPRSKYLLILWLQSLSIVILEPKKIKSLTVSTLPPTICHDVIGLDAVILVLWMLCFKPAFSCFFLTSSREYEQNQIPSNYTVEVTNRFKGLDLVDRMPEELWTKIHNIVKEVVTKTIPKKKKCKEAKWLSEEALEMAEKRSERQERMEDIPNWMQRPQEYQGEIRKPS